MNDFEIEEYEAEDNIAFTAEPVKRLSKDLAQAARTLTTDEARFLVDMYYNIQGNRMRASNQVGAMSKDMDAQGKERKPEPHRVISWLQDNSKTLENQLRRALHAYAKESPLGEWVLSITGIGPVISAGLLAHINCEVATAGKVWRFAGLDPTCVWAKGQKRPWNSRLKTLCWKIGESFVKFSGNKNDHYGKVYVERKKFEIQQNESGAYREQCEAILKARPNHAQREKYAAGILPDGHIHMRSKRYAVKMFVSHYHAVGHYLALKRLPPRPWVIVFGGHANLIAPPNMELVPGMSRAWAQQP